MRSDRSWASTAVATTARHAARRRRLRFLGLCLVVGLILPGVTAAPSDAAFNGANGAMSVVSRSADRGGDRATALLRMTSRGTRVRPVARCESNEFAPLPRPQPCPSSPDHSSDGIRLAFSLGDRLVVAESDGSRRAPLPPLTSSDREPAFSAGGKLVFSGIREGRRNLFVVDPDGAGLRQLTHGGGASPAWSSRGPIAYVRAGAIRVVRPDGTGDRRLTAGRAPDWSPSGRSLVYERKGRLYTLSIRRGARRRLVVRRGAFDPVFSPSGRRILFVRAGRFSRDRLETVPVRGGNTQAIIDAGGEGTSEMTDFTDPAWQPLPRRCGTRSGRRC